jgi:hypothetical protein
MNIIDIIHNLRWCCKGTMPTQACDHNLENTTDALLAELTQYGNPKLLKMDTGWWCFIESADVKAGAKLTIGSEIRHTHPAHAVSECLKRVEVSGLPRHPPLNTMVTHGLRR